jgi:glycogen(starch) synthase
VRVALVPSAYHPAVGGVEELTRRLAAQLIAFGDKVEIWTMQHPPELPARAIVDGLIVRRFPFHLPAARLASVADFPRRGWSALKGLRGAMREFCPDVVHVQCFGINGAYALALTELTDGVPLVVSLQGETVMDDQDIYEHSVTLRSALKLALRRADAVTACSQFTLDDATRRFGAPRGLSRVVFNGVDLDDEGARPATPIEGVEPGFVLGLGRMVQKKGFDLLLEAFGRLPQDCADTRLVLGGGGPELEALRTLASRLGVADRVVFAGYLDRAQVSWAMEHAAVFALPSRVEPFGIVVLEAMRAGRPVIVSDRGGAPEIVRDSVEGLTVDPFDVVAFAEALTRVLRDSVLRDTMGMGGRRRVTTFGWPDIAGQYRSIYRAVAASG